MIPCACLQCFSCNTSNQPKNIWLLFNHAVDLVCRKCRCPCFKYHSKCLLSACKMISALISLGSIFRKLFCLARKHLKCKTQRVYGTMKTKCFSICCYCWKNARFHSSLVYMNSFHFALSILLCVCFCLT